MLSTHTPIQNSVQTILAFDFGLKRIGVASGDTLTRTAAPRAAVAMQPQGPDWPQIDKEVRMLAPSLLVVGIPAEESMPREMGNDKKYKNKVNEAAENFAGDLQKRFGLPVHRVNERFSSVEAMEILKAKRGTGERKRRVRKEDIDSLAAAIILERWFAGESLGSR
jgi:putative holliday junction resolvase